VPLALRTVPLGPEAVSLASISRLRRTKAPARRVGTGPLHVLRSPLLGSPAAVPPPGRAAVPSRPLPPLSPSPETGVFRCPPEIAAMVAAAAERFDAIEEAHLDALLDRIGEAEVVLMGEASHGTSEFYRMRQRITRRLIEEKGF